MDELVLPRYGSSALSDLLPSIAAHLGLPGEDALKLPDAERYVVLLVDGLGLLQLQAAADRAPFLASALVPGQNLTSVVPSTTASALTSFGTGLEPGSHGVAGYSFRHPFTGGLLNALAWDPGLSGLDVQPRLTAFEKLARAGVGVASVLPARFGGTGLTEAGLRGGRFVGVSNEADAAGRIESVVAASTAQPRTFVYFYERVLDHAGHEFGWQSTAWREALAWVDALARDLRAALPKDVRLVITADHGMVDVPPQAHLVVEDEPDLLRHVNLFAGEGRLRQLYTAHPDEVAARWADRLGDDAWVRTRAQAIDEGWFGYVAPHLEARFGDVLVAARGQGAIMTRAQPRELALVGMHGSLTADEMLVPLIVE